MLCLSCGAELINDSRFCNQCGAKCELTLAVEEGEAVDAAIPFTSDKENASSRRVYIEAEHSPRSGASSHHQASSGNEEYHYHRNGAQKPLLTIKPRMVTWVVLARYIPTQINLTLIGAVIFGLIAVMYHFFNGTLTHPFRPFVFFATFFFFLFPLLVYIAYRRTMDSSYYEFYPDRLEYYEGFWTAHHKVLYYKHITDITLRRNLIQRMYGMGTIHFAVPNRGPKYEGLFVSDIENPVALFEKVEEIIRSY